MEKLYEASIKVYFQVSAHSEDEARSLIESELESIEFALAWPVRIPVKQILPVVNDDIEETV